MPHFLMPLLEMGMLGRLRWRDAGGEPQRDAVAGCPGVGLANRVLSDGASQDIAPCGPCNRVERLPEPRCAGLQRSPHLLPPVCRAVLRLHAGVRVAVSPDPIIRIPEDSGAPPVTLVGGWKGGGKSHFQSMEGAMHEAR